MAHILIIEDDIRIAENIAKGLNEKDYTTTIFHNGLEGTAFALKNEVDLVLLDLNLPDISGYNVCQKIKKAKILLPILMLTALGETEDKIEGFEKGADDYMVKPFDFRELLARVNVLLKRNQPLTEDPLIKIANLSINTHNKTVSRGTKKIDLTPKEYSLLEYLVQNKNNVVSKEELSNNVWNGQSLNVVEVYINFLRNKVDKNHKPKLIYTKSGMGYILKEP